VGEGSCAAEGKLEGLFEEKTAKDHELVAVAVFCLPLAHIKSEQETIAYVVA
jgi:hypothetical protein